MTADGAYDGQVVYDAVAERHPEAVVIIPPRITSVADEMTATQRDKHLTTIAEHGRMSWQRSSGYNRRSLVENGDVPIQDRYRPTTSTHKLYPQSTDRGKSRMQRAQSDDRSRHAGLRPDPLTRKPRRGPTTVGLFAHQRAGKAVKFQWLGFGVPAGRAWPPSAHRRRRFARRGFAKLSAVRQCSTPFGDALQLCPMATQVGASWQCMQLDGMDERRICGDLRWLHLSVWRRAANNDFPDRKTSKGDYGIPKTGSKTRPVSATFEIAVDRLRNLSSCNTSGGRSRGVS